MEVYNQQRSLFLIEGIIFIVLGLLAVAAPVIFTFGVEISFGVLLIIGGIAQGYRAFNLLHKQGFYPTLLASALFFILGLIFILNPVKGVLTLTFFLMLFFFCSGIFKMIMAFQLRPLRNWGWVFLSGVFALLLGVIILLGWPGTALWTMGLLLGIDMLFFGIALTTLAMHIEKST
jgi:uncharacterized membrane protein HdeD (DUF308 family)